VDANRRASIASLFDDSQYIREIEPGFYTVLPETAAAPYDRKAAVYDAVVGRPIYHRVFWGTSSATFARFGRAALAAAGKGAFAEAGCGSLLFTAAMHREPRAGVTLLIDRSVQMLRRAARRLSPRQGLALLHADMGALPMRSATFSSVLCLNVLHVTGDVARLTTELARVLEPGGRLFVSALVRTGRWSDSYMRVLERMGELAAPITRDELCARVAGACGAVESASMEGNMCYLIARR
jgi:SAM-dependent methyltransferase